ncbi:MAG: response regulator transcription factor [Bacteroidota bacterium]|nr:response regulator transcription factor [Bacteroidota bacterium]
MINGARVIICDDHTLFRKGIVSLLNEEPNIYIVDEAGSGKELIAKYKDKLPDIIISDISMPVMSGIEALNELKKLNPDIKVIFLSMYEDEQYVYQCYKAGAWGLISKNINKNELLFAINCVMENGKYFGPKYDENKLNALLEKFNAGMFNDKSNSYKYEGTLSDREKEVLGYIAKGKKSTEIAVLLDISIASINFHRHNIMTKMGLNNLPSLIKFAIDFCNKNNLPL